MESIKIEHLDFCDLTFYKDFVISEIKEGVNLNLEHIKIFHSHITNFFGEGKSYGYISLRINDYNVNPMDYINCQFYEFITGMAVVSSKPTKQSTANFEKAFFKKPLEVFYTIEEAVRWLQKLPTGTKTDS